MNNVIEELLLAARSAADGETPEHSGIEAALRDFDRLDAENREQRRRRVAALDLVASWPPELRQAVELIEALTPEGKALLPDVLRGLSVRGMPELVEAQVGAVSTAAMAAAWAGGLSGEDLELLAQALVTAMGTYRERDQPGLADRLLGMWEALGAVSEQVPLDANAARILASRTPRRQFKGTFPPVEVGQVREGPANIVGRSRVTRVFEEFGEWWARTDAVATGRQDVYPVAFVEEWPLAQDFEPSDLAGLAKREAQPERVWKKGALAPVAAGQKREGEAWGDGVIVWKVKARAQLETDWLCTAAECDGVASLPESGLAKMPLAEDFEPSAAKPEPRVWRAGTVPPRPEVGMLLLYHGMGELLKVTGVDLAGQVHLETPSGQSAGWWTWNKHWKLAEDFPIPEDA